MLRYTTDMIYDATLPLSPALVAWPGDPHIEVDCIGEDVVVSRWVLGSHAGTHVDAPAHFGYSTTVDLLDPAILMGPCRVLDLGDTDRITAATFRGQPLDGVARVLLRTRNSQRWATDLETFHRDFIGLDLFAAQYLLECGIALLGVDGLSIEPFDGDGTVHELLLGNGVLIVEGLNLATVPAGDYHLVCAPLRLQNADGAPARVWLTNADGC